MRELIVVTEDSDANSLVLTWAQPRPDTTTGEVDSDAAHNAEAGSETDTVGEADANMEPELFFIEVTDELRTLLLGNNTAVGVGTHAAHSGTNQSPSHEATTGASTATGESGGASTHTASTAKSAASAQQHQSSAAENNSNDAAAPNSSSGADSEGNAGTKDTDGQENTAQSREPRESREIDPGLSAPLNLRPREIQERVRAGKTLEEVAEEAGVSVSRIEPFAHPVLLERSRIAEMAKQSHPVREDGPAQLTLFEVLATAFAARDIDMSTATWDAFRDAAGQWVVRVSWRAGLQQQYADWSYHGRGVNPTTAVARNAIAADLIDPDFAAPVRSLLTRTRDDIPVVADEEDTIHTEGKGSSGTGSPKSERETKQQNTKTSQENAGVTALNNRSADTNTPDEDDTLLDGEQLLQHPSPNPQPAKKKTRKAVTPHWEDVLLGVRASTKRPRK